MYVKGEKNVKERYDMSFVLEDNIESMGERISR